MDLELPVLRSSSCDLDWDCFTGGDCKSGNCNLFEEMHPKDSEIWRPPNRILEVTIHRVYYPMEINWGSPRSMMFPWSQEMETTVKGLSSVQFCSASSASTLNEFDCKKRSMEADAIVAHIEATALGPATGGPTIVVPLGASVSDVIDHDIDDEIPESAVVTIPKESVTGPEVVYIASYIARIMPNDINTEVVAAYSMRFPDSDIGIQVLVNDPGTALTLKQPVIPTLESYASMLIVVVAGKSECTPLVITFRAFCSSVVNKLGTTEKTIGSRSKDSTKELQMPWDPGLENLHRLDGESIFKKGRMLGTAAHCVQQPMPAQDKSNSTKKQQMRERGIEYSEKNRPILLLGSTVSRRLYCSSLLLTLNPLSIATWTVPMAK
ncbi:hypothetical protein U9M48_017739 [Paspalum notatum var. saurae]|uniref:Uncharacterized protein n=1 Tax=Paspalum notatum var. saurae TaxID=547442 RepID=A0AAQ3TAW6_PASNO